MLEKHSNYKSGFASSPSIFSFSSPFGGDRGGYLSAEEVANITTENAQNIFKIY
jgi:hypothetical protein